MRMDDGDHPGQQRIAGSMAFAVVDGLQTNDIDVRHAQQTARAVRTLDLMLKIRQPRRTHARPGQRVRLGECQLRQQRFTVIARPGAVDRRPLTIARRVFAVSRRPRPRLGRRDPIASRAPALLGGAHHDLRTRYQPTPTLLRGVTSSQRQVLPRRGPIALQRGHVASMRDRVALGRRLDTLPSRPATIRNTTIAQPARHVVLKRIPAMRNITIARGLIALTRRLIAIGGRLIAVRPRLIAIRERLLAVGARLIPRRRTGNRRNAVLCIDRLVPGAIP